MKKNKKKKTGTDQRLTSCEGRRRLLCGGETTECRDLLATAAASEGGVMAENVMCNILTLYCAICHTHGLKVGIIKE